MYWLLVVRFWLIGLDGWVLISFSRLFSQYFPFNRPLYSIFISFLNQSTKKEEKNKEYQESRKARRKRKNPKAKAEEKKVSGRKQAQKIRSRRRKAGRKGRKSEGQKRSQVARSQGQNEKMSVGIPVVKKIG